MRFSFLSAALAAVPSLVSAIAFTGPAGNSTITSGDKVVIPWTYVSTDPSTFSIFLWNFVNWPPFYTLLAEDVPTAAGKAEIEMPCSLGSSYGWQFNAINGTNVYVIYAQTSKFFLKQGTCQDPPPTTRCGPPVQVTLSQSTCNSKH